MTEDSSLQGETRVTLWRYTNGPTTFFYPWDRQYVGLHMDTWYLVQRLIAKGAATIGVVELGEGPLTLAQGVYAFAIQQAQAFVEHFAVLARPATLYIGLASDLADGGAEMAPFPVPATENEVRKLLADLDEEMWWTEETGDVPYAGVPTFFVLYDLLVTVRNELGAYQEIWLPKAGEVTFNAQYLEESKTYPFPLTALGQAGRAPWTATVRCDVASLFRPNNSEMLERVRTYWRVWLEAHLPDAAPGKEIPQKLLQEVRERRDDEAYVMALAEPPDGTPLDNQDLYERNWPRLQAAVQRWERWLQHPFRWTL